MGAGQTIYIVVANSDPNVTAELSTFNQNFGLPACTATAIATNASLPLAAANKTACQLSVVYSTTSGTMTVTAPAYDSGWSVEIALDVRWAHATAPLARIVLIEAPDASITSLLAAVNLANNMGPGAVSMSFDAPEGSWTSSLESAFAAPNMIYLTATGDSGTGVEWPCVSPNVLAADGTSLTYSGTGSLSEITWPSTGGGISGYVAAPIHQTSSIPCLGARTRRAVAASNPVTYSLSSQPAGLTVDSTGAVSRAAPVADIYAVTITAKDSKTGLSGSGLYTITISKPAVGNYAVTLSAKDGVTGLSGSGVFNVSISSAGPQIVA